MLSQFLAQLKKLNPEQKKAVDTIEGPVMVIAGPGTGKTQILTLRIANILLKTQINPENILALTFSESASFEMRERLVQIIGTLGYRVEISTFHSFANSIISDYPEEFGRLISSNSIAEDEQIEIIEKIIESTDLKLLRPWGEPLYYVRDILSSVNSLKKEGITPAKLSEGLKRQQKDFEKIEDLLHNKGKYKGQMKGKYAEELKQMKKLEEFIKVFALYENKLVKQKKYDFSDMLVEVVSVLQKNQNLLLLLQEKYQYILVDEHQDTNASQNRLVELLASFYEMPNLFVVGDEKQAIYRFQGASLENFLYFQKKYPAVKLINLNKNYRSHQMILDASGSFISKNISANLMPIQIKLIAQKNQKEQKIKLISVDDYFGEFEYIAREIEKLIKKMKPSEIAVLARRNFELSELADFLKRKKIPFIIDADLDALSNLWVSKLLLILDSIASFEVEEKFIKTLYIDSLGIDPVSIARLIRLAKEKHISIFEVLEKSKDFKKMTDYYQIFKNWIILSKNIKLDDLFVTILNESKIREGFIKLPERNEILNKFITLFEYIKRQVFKDPAYLLEDFLRSIQTLKKHNLSLKAKSNITQAEGVKLLTVHKAKGLEFSSVFIIQCIAGRWGSLRRSEKIKIPWQYLGENVKTQAQFEAIEDERRLFYVGLTRAKEEVFLTYSKFSEGNKEQLPSQFLQELDPNLLEIINTQQFNQDFFLKKEMLLDKPIEAFEKGQEFDYFKKLFLEKGLSITGFENFLECPWKYFFINLISIPTIKNKYQIFGIAVHESLDLLIKRRKIEKNPKKFLLKSFERKLSQHGLSETERQEYLDKGVKALEGFYDQVFMNFTDLSISEFVIRGVKISDNLILNGRIDMLEEVKKGEFLIHDFKTGRPKSRKEIEEGSGIKRNILNQLIFYKILLDKYKNNFYQVKEGVVDFVEPDKKGRFLSERFEIKEDQEKDLLKELQEAANQISSLSFWNDFCPEKDCEWCNLRRMMG